MQKQRDVFLSSLCWQGVEEGVYPGAAAALVFREKNQWNKVLSACGHTCSGGAGKAVGRETFFDLASLTKPLCTALACLSLASTNKLDLYSSVRALPCCAAYPSHSHWQDIRLVDLLSHCSGLPAYREYYRDFQAVQEVANKGQLLALIQEEALEYQPRSKSLCSDLGYMVLGSIVEEISGLSLDSFFSRILAEPCGLNTGIGFRPIGQAKANTEQIAATELCPWRRRLLVGEVHDEHAWLMHGVAGHAGLFGQVEAVATLCTLLVDIWHGRANHANLDSHLVREALAYKTEAGLWALGFDRPTPGQSSSGDSFSATSIGHLGYAGTSFWIDLEREIVVVLLTNRVHPSRENRKIQQFRPYFHNSIMEMMERA